VLLTQRAELLSQAREAVHSSGYAYRKGKSRSKHVISDSGTERPKRLKLDKEMRKQKTESLEEDIAALNKQIAFKQKRLEQAETVRRYEQCEMINSEIQEVRAKKRGLELELAEFQKKEKKARWYQRRKKAVTPKLSTSDESDVPLSSPSLSTSSFDRSRSMSLEACDDNPDQNVHVAAQNGSGEVIAVDGGESGTSELEVCNNVVVESNPVFHRGLPASQETVQGGRF